MDGLGGNSHICKILKLNKKSPVRGMHLGVIDLGVVVDGTKVHEIAENIQ